MFKKDTTKFSMNNILGLIYFYFNTVLLPAPVTFTTILSLFWTRQAITKFGKLFLGIFGILTIYAIIHNVNGVVVFDYFKSSAYFMAVLFSGFVAYLYLKASQSKIEKSFELLSLAGLILVIVGTVALLTPAAKIFWADHAFVNKNDLTLRFQGLIYEPSHLALTLSPLFLYFMWKSINKIQLRNLFFLFAIALPIGLTISFGFVAALLISIFFTLLTVLLVYQKFKRILILPIVGVLIAILAVSFTTNNISKRLTNIVQGKDTSVNGRTTEAFMLGYKCAELKNIWFGIGLGQVKYVGEEIIRPYYAAMDPVGYSKENWPVIQIPTNSMAETLATFGIFGILLKIGFQIFCFLKLKVYDNYLNLSIFGFIFFYQMMGSFILSSTEIIMWAFAFAKIFPEFDVHSKLSQPISKIKSTPELEK